MAVRESEGVLEGQASGSTQQNEPVVPVVGHPASNQHGFSEWSAIEAWREKRAIFDGGSGHAPGYVVGINYIGNPLHIPRNCPLRPYLKQRR